MLMGCWHQKAPNLRRLDFTPNPAVASQRGEQNGNEKTLKLWGVGTMNYSQDIPSTQQIIYDEIIPQSRNVPSKLDVASKVLSELKFKATTSLS